MVQRQVGQTLTQVIELESGMYQGAQKHVAGDSGERIDVQMRKHGGMIGPCRGAGHGAHQWRPTPLSFRIPRTREPPMSQVQPPADPGTPPPTPGSPVPGGGGGTPALPPRPPVSGGGRVPPPPPPGYPGAGYPPVMIAAPQQRFGWVTKVLTTLLSSLLVTSIVLNIYFAALFAARIQGLQYATYRAGDPTQRILVVPVEGMIDDSVAQFVHEATDEIRSRPPKAIILRVDSGGGGVAPSDRIWHDLTRLRKDLEAKDLNVPVVASFGSLAASGGYYVSAHSDFIIAEPTCLTGSIGVIAPAFTVDKLMEKIGVTPEVITATASTEKDIANNIMRPWSERDRTKLRQVLDAMCDRFIGIVAEGRKDHLKEEEVKALATGEAFTADQAKDKKLIDEIGYLEDAIDKAATLAKIDPKIKPEVLVVKPAQHFGLMTLLGSRAPTPAGQITSDLIRKWAAELAVPRLEYRIQLSP